MGGLRLLLTSTGLENPALLRAFVRLLPCGAAQARALFIPTAAVDCVYLCGGNTGYLAARVREISFGAALADYLASQRGAVVGVSAGSLIFSSAWDAGLSLLPHPLRVHCPVGSPDGALPEPGAEIRLSNAQGILYRGADAPRILS